MDFSAATWACDASKELRSDLFRTKRGTPPITHRGSQGGEALGRVTCQLQSASSAFHNLLIVPIRSASKTYDYSSNLPRDESAPGTKSVQAGLFFIPFPDS